LRIDSHHSFSERYPLAHLESILKRNRFEGGILVGAECWPDHDFVKGVVVCGDRFSASQLDAYQAHPKFCGVCCAVRAGELPDFLGELERRAIPLDLSGTLAAASEIARRFPVLRIAIDHLGAPFEVDWAGMLEEAATHPNVFCKLSGLARMGPPARLRVRHAMAVFGPDRLMFGSDWPNSLPEHSWKENLAAFTQAIGAQPLDIREELLGGTAARFYSL
jgi:L-fuconolactonase